MPDPIGTFSKRGSNIESWATSRLATLSEPLSLEPVGIALSPSAPRLRNLLENFMGAFEGTGIFDELRKKWLENDAWIAALPCARLTAAVSGHSDERRDLTVQEGPGPGKTPASNSESAVVAEPPVPESFGYCEPRPVLHSDKTQRAPKPAL